MDKASLIVFLRENYPDINHEEIERYYEAIQLFLNEDNRLVAGFFYNHRKSAFCRSLRKIARREPLDSVNTAVAMTSMLTSFILSRDVLLLNKINIHEYTSQLTKLVTGEISSEEAQDYLRGKFEKYIRSEDAGPPNSDTPEH